MLTPSSRLRRGLGTIPGLKPLYLWFQSHFQLPGTSSEMWARVVMNRQTHNLIQALPARELSVLEISGRGWEKRFQFKSYKSVGFPEFDVCRSALDEQFDLVIAEQVFEHLLWPYRAGRNVYKMLRPGGHFLLTTPFMLKIHEVPIDCSRWTETGIKHLLAECGFNLDQVRTGAWGNRACVRANFNSWVKFHPWLHSLQNDPEFAVVVWALAKK